MKKNVLIICLQILGFFAFGQQLKTSSRILEKSESEKLLSKSIKVELGIQFPVFRTYEYTDKAGKHYLVLTEDTYKKESEETLNKSIKGYNLKLENGRLKVEWTLTDALKKNKGISDEYSIWFWSKYIDLIDLDKDGYIEPIITYGTSGDNGTDNGRVRILIYYKGVKNAIRHQNGVLDFQRNIQIDSTFYKLPTVIQQHVKSKMELMSVNNLTLFPNDWHLAMKKNQSIIKE